MVGKQSLLSVNQVKQMVDGKAINTSMMIIILNNVLKMDRPTVIVAPFLQMLAV